VTGTAPLIKNIKGIFDEIKDFGDPYAPGHLDEVGGFDAELSHWSDWKDRIARSSTEVQEAAQSIKDYLAKLGGFLADDAPLKAAEVLASSADELNDMAEKYIETVKQSEEAEKDEIEKASHYRALYNTLQQIIGAPGADEFSVDRDAIDEQSHTNMTDSPKDAMMQFLQHDDVVIVGTTGFPASLLSRTDFFTAGQVVVTDKGGVISSGSISVGGAADEDQFKAAIKRFSKKSVKFV
jgi:hypothetical protein